MSPASLEPAIPATERPQNNASNHTATGIGIRLDNSAYVSLFLNVWENKENELLLFCRSTVVALRTSSMRRCVIGCICIPHYEKVYDITYNRTN